MSVLKPNDAQELLDQFLNEKEMTTEFTALRLVVSSALGPVFKVVNSPKTGPSSLFLTVSSSILSSVHFLPQSLPS